MNKIELVGCSRYNFKQTLYEKGKHYIVPEVRAKLLCRLRTSDGFAYFKPVGVEAPPPEVVPEKDPTEIEVIDTTRPKDEPEFDEEGDPIGVSEDLAPKVKGKAKKEADVDGGVEI